VTWLIKLYPPSWQRRYGREMAELIASQPASFGMAIDLVAAAIDAWLNPQSSSAAIAADAKGAGAMVPKMLQLKCAGEGPEITTADSGNAAAVMIGGTIVLVIALTWATEQFGHNRYLDSLFSVSWILPMLFGLRYTSLKGRSGWVQAIFIAGNAAAVLGIVLLAAWMTSWR
jgi:hypothetical protein